MSDQHPPLSQPSHRPSRAPRIRLGADEAARLAAHCADTGQTATQAINELVRTLPAVAPQQVAPKVNGWPCPSCGNGIGISGIRTGICTTEGCERWMTLVEVPQAPHGPAPDGVEVEFWTNCMRCGLALYVVAEGDSMRSFHDATDERECSPAPQEVATST